MVRDAKELLKMTVMVTSTGREIGTVDRFLWEPGAHRMYGLVLKPGDKNDPELVVRPDDIRAYGGQAITIESEAATTVLDADSRARELVQADSHLGGTKVLTEDGNDVGKIDTVLLNDDGTIAVYRTAGGLLGLGSGTDITPDQVVAAGPDAIVVLAAAVT